VSSRLALLWTLISGNVLGGDAGGVAGDGTRQPVPGAGGVDLHLDPVQHGVQAVDRRPGPDRERLHMWSSERRMPPSTKPV